MSVDLPHGECDLYKLHRLLTENASDVLDAPPKPPRVAQRRLAVVAMLVATVALQPLLLGIEPLIGSASYSDRGGRRDGEHIGHLAAGRLDLEWEQVAEATHYSIVVWDEDGSTLLDRLVAASTTELSIPVDAAVRVSWRISAWRGAMPLSRDRVGIALSHASAK